MALIATLSDNFNDNSFDFAKWDSFGNLASVAETGGRQVLTPNASDASSDGFITSINAYDLTAGSLTAEVPTVLALIAGCYSALTLTTDEFDGSNRITIEKDGTELFFYKVVGGVRTDFTTQITYSNTTHRWWRIRHVAPNVLLETSPDGTTWTTRATGTPGITITALYVRRQTGTYIANATPGTSSWDNVNVSVSAGLGASGAGQATGTAALRATARLGATGSGQATGTAGFPTVADYYVATTGNDTTGNGTSGNPWRTIQKAADSVSSVTVQTVALASGTYAEQIIVTHNFNLVGPADRSAIIDSSMTVGGWSNVGGEVWTATFQDADYAPNAGNLGQGYPGVFPNKTSPSASNDILAWCHVDNGNTQASWLRPRPNGTSLARGEFSTNALNDQGTPFSTHQITVRLSDGTSPNSHSLCIPRYFAALYWLGATGGAMTVSGVTFQHAGFHMLDCDMSNVTFSNIECRWYKGFGVNTYFNRTGILVTDSFFRYYEYEAVHLQANNSTIQYNTVGPHIARWSIYGGLAFNVSGGDDNVVKGNDISGMLYSSGSTGGYAIQNESWYRDGAVHGHRNTYERNRIHGCDTHAITLEGQNHKVRNNLIYDCGGVGISGYQGTGGGSHPNEATGLEIYNNTLVGNAFNSVLLGYGVNAFQFDNATTATLRGNIVYGNTGGDIYAASGTTITQSNNLWGGTNPLFVDLAGRDLRLSASSPAIGAGVALSGVTVDFAGVARPQGGGYDLGAYEYVAPGGGAAALAGSGAGQASGTATLRTATRLAATGAGSATGTVAPPASVAGAALGATGAGQATGAATLAGGVAGASLAATGAGQAVGSATLTTTSQVTLFLTVGAHGAVSGNTGTYVAGTLATLTATGDTGYQLGAWVVDGVSVGPTNPLPVPMVADHRVAAVFIPAVIQYPLR